MKLPRIRTLKTPRRTITPFRQKRPDGRGFKIGFSVYKRATKR